MQKELEQKELEFKLLQEKIYFYHAMTTRICESKSLSLNIGYEELFAIILKLKNIFWKISLGKWKSTIMLGSLDS